MCWVGGKMTGERTEDDQISLILLTSKAQLRRLAQGASGKDSMTHTHTPLSKVTFGSFSSVSDPLHAKE